MNKEILGCWVLDPNDVNSFEVYGDISLEFKANGELIYTIHSAIKDEIIVMAYEIKGSLLITDQPSSPKKEETEFKMISEDRLELFFGGERSIYVRKPIS
jgi:hypothetical protein